MAVASKATENNQLLLAVPVESQPLFSGLGFGIDWG